MTFPCDWNLITCPHVGVVSCAQLKVRGSVTERQKEKMYDWHDRMLPMNNNYNLCGTSVGGMKRTEDEKRVKREEGRKK